MTRNGVLALVFCAIARAVFAQGDVDATSIRLFAGGSERCAVSTGTGAPSGGNTCDTYIDYATGDIYSKRSGTWTIIPRLERANTWSAAQTFSAQILSSDGTSTAPGVAFSSDTDLGLRRAGTNRQELIAEDGTAFRRAGGSRYGLVNWDSDGALYSFYDYSTDNVRATLHAEAANTIGLANSTNAMRFNVYNTRTSLSNCEFAYLWWNSNIARLGTSKCASGTNRNLRITPGDVLAVSFGTDASSAFSGLASGATYVSRLTSWGIDAAGGADFRSIYSDELHARSFVVENEHVVDGSWLVTPNVAVLAADFTVPALGASSGNLRVEYKNNSTANVFSAGDTVLMRVFNRIGGALEVTNVIGVVSSPDSSNASYQQWTFTRGSNNATGGSLAALVTVPAKTAVVDYGVSGNGFVQIDATAPTRLLGITSSGTTATGTTDIAHGYQTGDSVVVSGAAESNYNGSFTITATGSQTFTYTMPGTASSPASGRPLVTGAYSVNTPYLRVATWTTAPSAATTTVRLQLGNLRGLTGTAEYGLLAGNFTGNAYVRLSDQNAEIVGIPLSLKDSGTTTIKLDASVPSIAMGSTLPTAYGTGTGLWMGKDSGSYKFRLGNPSGGQDFAFDGTTLTAAGWTIGNTTITGGNATLDSAGDLTLGTSNDVARISATDSTYRLWIGHATAGSAPFRVSKAGALTATSVNITAGGVTLDGTGLYISPESAATGGTFSNANAVRWTTDTAARTAIWRDDQTSGTIYQWWHFDNIAPTATVVDTRNDFIAKQTDGGGAGYGWGRITQRGQTGNVGEVLITGEGNNATVTRDAYMYVGTDVAGGTASIRYAVLAVGTPPALTGGSVDAGTITQGLFIDATAGITTNFITGATNIAGGGLTLGSPTGGDKGAGTINAQAVYDDNVLLTDWVFDLYYDGATTQPEAPQQWPPTSRRLYSLADVKTSTRDDRRLPWMPKADEFEVARGTGAMITRLYQGQEQLQLYIFELEARLAALEQKGGRER